MKSIDYIIMLDNVLDDKLQFYNDKAASFNSLQILSDGILW